MFLRKLLFCVLVLNLHRKHIKVYINFNLVYILSLCINFAMVVVCCMQQVLWKRSCKHSHALIVDRVATAEIQVAYITPTVDCLKGKL